MWEFLAKKGVRHKELETLRSLLEKKGINHMLPFPLHCYILIKQNNYRFDNE